MSAVVVIVIVVVFVVFVALVSVGLVTATRTRRRGAGTAPAEAPAPVGAVPAAAEATGAPAAEAAGAPAAEAAGVEAPIERPALRDRLGRARDLLGGYLQHIRGREVDEGTFEELEEALLLADVGVSTTNRVLEDLREKVRSSVVDDSADALIDELRSDLESIFAGDDQSLRRGDGDGPTVWLFVGVNGAGKTTSIGKLAAREIRSGSSVVLAAGDTFRAAAGEQLEQWAERSGAGLIRGAEGADPSSVIFDAVEHAAARSVDLVMADTAGRFHTKVNLMEELRKVRRVAERPPGNLEEVLLVLDATTGQNGLVQARQFGDAVGVTGVVLTKLDGTAKGGVVLAIRDELGIPIKLVGVGEGLGDLIEFDPKEFVAALFD